MNATTKLWADVANRTGKLIVICGLDASGKSTQIKLLNDYFSNNNIPFITTRQPTEFYRENPIVREFLKYGGTHETARILSLLSAVDRLIHCKHTVEPALKSGLYITCDRYIYSALAYFPFRKVSREFIVEINEGIPKPDYTFFIDLSVEKIVARLKSRDGGNLKFEEQHSERLDFIRNEFLKYREEFLILEGSASPDVIHKQILKTILDGGNNT